jgi:hypothetical protein
MFGHVAFREQPSRRLALPFLAAMALAWSFAIMQSRVGEVRLSLGAMLAVAVGLPALRDGVILIGRRRREKKERHGEADEAPAEESAPEENRPTYEDIFGAPVVTDGDQVESGDGDHDDTVRQGEDDEPVGEIQADGDAGWMDDGDQMGDGDGMTVELEAGDGDGMTVEVDGDGMTVEVEVEAGDGEPRDADVDEPTADVDAIRSELESEEAIRLLREEFKARAQEAELRIKQRQAELEQAPSA